MKKLSYSVSAIAVLTALLAVNITLPVFAASKDSENSKVETGVAASSAAGPTAKAWEEVRENIKTMQSQMKRIRATKDPATRNILLDQHMRTMQATLQLMMGNTGGDSISSNPTAAETRETPSTTSANTRRQTENALSARNRGASSSGMMGGSNGAGGMNGGMTSGGMGGGMGGGMMGGGNIGGLLQLFLDQLQQHQRALQDSNRNSKSDSN